MRLLLTLLVSLASLSCQGSFSHFGARFPECRSLKCLWAAADEEAYEYYWKGYRQTGEVPAHPPIPSDQELRRTRSVSPRESQIAHALRNSYKKQRERVLREVRSEVARKARAPGGWWNEPVVEILGEAEGSVSAFRRLSRARMCPRFREEARRWLEEKRGEGSTACLAAASYWSTVYASTDETRFRDPELLYATLAECTDSVDAAFSTCREIRDGSPRSEPALATPRKRTEETTELPPAPVSNRPSLLDSTPYYPTYEEELRNIEAGPLPPFSPLASDLEVPGGDAIAGSTLPAGGTRCEAVTQPFRNILRKNPGADYCAKLREYEDTIVELREAMEIGPGEPFRLHVRHCVGPATNPAYESCN